MAEHLNEMDFETEVLKSEELVIVDFFADWCGPCKRLAPTLEEVAEEFNVRIFKVDVDNATALAAEYGIMSIPTVIFFKNGNIIDKFVGLIPKEDIIGKLNAACGRECDKA